MKPLRVARFLIALTAGLSPWLNFASEAPQSLVVYSYDSFAARGGLGSEVIPLFEKKCECKVKLIPVGSAGQLVTRVQLDRKRGVLGAHVVLGLDSHTFSQLSDEISSWGNWRPKGFEKVKPEAKIAQDFLPLDLGYFSWMVDLETLKKFQGTDAKPPRNITELLRSSFKRSFLLEDPRTSTPGLAFLLYTDALLGNQAADFWRSFRSQWLTLTPGWDAAYGLFLKGEAPFVWSYTTSQAFHEERGEKGRFRAILFDEGQPVQVEGAALLKSAEKDSRILSEARAFLEFLLSKDVQSRVPLKNWMFPVVLGTKLPASFESLPQPKKLVKIQASHDKISRLLQDWSSWVQGVK